MLLFLPSGDGFELFRGENYFLSSFIPFQLCRIMNLDGSNYTPKSLVKHSMDVLTKLKSKTGKMMFCQVNQDQQELD